jgi:AraC-like DNA-binding protein
MLWFMVLILTTTKHLSFEDTAYFNRFFKQNKKMTSSTFRREVGK